MAQARRKLSLVTADKTEPIGDISPPDNTTLEVVEAVEIEEPPIEALVADDANLAFHEAEHIGKRKKEQQDAHGHVVINEPACHLFVVADGVSMGQAGALASQTAVNVLLKNFQEQIEIGKTSDLSHIFAAAFAAANNEVYKLAQTRPGMATTCVAALIIGDVLITAHVGDSRVYLIRKGLDLMPVTIDHSWVAEMGELLVKQGQMSPQELAKDARRHTITRAFGLQDQIAADFNLARLSEGDLVILCSDGLWDMLPDGVLDQISRETTDLNTMSSKLLEAALNAGGRDNISFSLVRILNADDTSPDMPSLDSLLEHTAAEVIERTRPVLSERERKPLVQTTSPIKLVAKSTMDDAMETLEDVPSPKPITFNPDKLLAKAQQYFALGEWDEAITNFIELELAQASNHGLFESFLSSIVRYVGVAIGDGRIEQAEQLLKRLERNNIVRYNDGLADYCNEESRQAAVTNHYPASKAYAIFCLKLRPNDIRAKNLTELNDSYITMQKPILSLNERLAIAQKIYARDENFGSIADDLANIYMELGDEASKEQAWEDAANWYSMITPLRPKDGSLANLATSKQRTAHDNIKRKALNLTKPETVPSLRTNLANLRASERQRTINDGRPEQELVNRLKDRVSRAQKAWDGGRKEVGSEYIYLVDQLNELLSPNPWQPTFPRVCYDYARWLYDQKQYEEARPYFQKSHQLGMTAAQQRVGEIDRLVKERNQDNRGVIPLDLPDDPPPPDRANIFRSSFELPMERVSQVSSMFTTRKPPSSSMPLLPPKPEVPATGTFVGASRSTFGTVPIQAPEKTNFTNSPITARFAGAVASGNLTMPPPEISLQDEPQIREKEISELVEVKPQFALAVIPPSHIIRHPNPNSPLDPVHEAAQREVSRIAGTGLPQSLNPRMAMRRRWIGFFGLLRGVVLPGMVITVVLLGVFLLASTLMNLPKSQPAPTVTVVAVQATATAANTIINNTIAAPTPSLPASTGTPAFVRIQGAKPDEISVFLVDAGEPNSPYRELESDGTFFRLPAATLNRLDPKQRYLIVARPKDTATRKYAQNLPTDNPAQRLFTSPDFSFDPIKGFEIDLPVGVESLAFYPVPGNGTDSDVPNGGGRYIGATNHIIKGDFLKYYNANGGLARFGFPLSEEFDWANNGRVQFFERAWLTIATPGQPVTVGKIGKSLVDSTCTNIPRLPSGVASLAAATLKPDPAFIATLNALKLGAPISQPFEVNKVKFQYFELGRLELAPPVNEKDKKVAPPALGLLGVEHAKCYGWLK